MNAAQKRLAKKFLQESMDDTIHKTNAIVVGAEYFLSVFFDAQGHRVKVLSKSTKKNSAGWPSSVVVRYLEYVGDWDASDKTTYNAVGTIHIVNACNLYKNREEAKRS